MPVRDLPDQAARATVREEPPPLGTPVNNRVAYRRLTDPAPDALAVIRFGTAPAAPPGAQLCIDVGLQPIGANDVAEVWQADGPVSTARVGAIRYAADSRSLFGVIELDEREYGGICAAAEAAYSEITAFQQNSAFPALLRMWNYLDAINQVSGELERYRQFCLGRARALSATAPAQYPAASGIGRQQATHKLQIYWLAGRTPGTAVENPRQVSAYHYPPEHGPASPSFSRASVASDGTLFVSGTASIVGHTSLHGDDPMAQLQETLRNLKALTAGSNGATIDGRGVLKVYVRNRKDADTLGRALREHLPNCPTLLLAGDICRKELLLEIEAVVGG